MPNPLITCLWFDGNAAEAAEYYVSIFPDSKITARQVYPQGDSEQHRSAGRDLAVEFELNGHKFVGLNGGPKFRFSPAISFQIICDDQAEIDYYWDKLKEGGDPEAQVCAWVADKFGVSWQVVYKKLPDVLAGEDRARASRAMAKMMGMKKLIVEELENA
ncbi:3-demethylubiquinone-9 3-methyltransferase [Metarhizium acridum CQMa 102]|uniref:3-demethylubiquinone-9 3-methyltransferase n=1 Tax=Metarhizium acridum (strain CQMa 102) TaxID=655827 RepID=E9DR30_METAQ|nr:3-demethylubiquinone-9 3-methyltransferase [Metarhizium acridum CQMa 102]EFY93708.1 3-demethylubiquinone-9 3-methyltransferase [Metarhizium acridum CQMa 102]